MAESSPIAIAVVLGLALVALYGVWQFFKAGGESGIVGLVPIVNAIGLARIGGNKWYWGLATFVPIVGIAVGAKLLYDAFRSFGMSTISSIVALPIWWIILPSLGITARYGSTEYDGANRSAGVGQETAGAEEGPG